MKVGHQIDMKIQGFLYNWFYARYHHQGELLKTEIKFIKLAKKKQPLLFLANFHIKAYIDRPECNIFYFLLTFPLDWITSVFVFLFGPITIKEID